MPEHASSFVIAVGQLNFVINPAGRHGRISGQIFALEQVEIGARRLEPEHDRAADIRFLQQLIRQGDAVDRRDEVRCIRPALHAPEPHAAEPAEPPGKAVLRQSFRLPG